MLDLYVYCLSSFFGYVQAPHGEGGYWVRTRTSLCLLSLDMYCIVFSCVIYSHLKAFGKKGKNKTQGKIRHSRVDIAFSVDSFHFLSYLLSFLTPTTECPMKYDLKILHI